MRPVFIKNILVLVTSGLFMSCDHRTPASSAPDGYKPSQIGIDVRLVGMNCRLAPGDNVPSGSFHRVIIGDTVIPVINHQFEDGGLILTRDFGKILIQITGRGDIQLYLTDAQQKQIADYFGISLQKLTVGEACAKAEQGNTEAQYRLGQIYRLGLGGEHRDDTKAMEWYLKAAELGHPKAQLALGRCYELKDKMESLKWYRKAAEQGLAQAQNHLSFIYEYGLWGVVAKDEMESLKWARKAAEQGLAQAEIGLGHRYRKGKGVDKDEIEAVKWYRKAAESGNATGARFLGECYADGSGVSKDMRIGYGWLLVADEGWDPSNGSYPSLLERLKGVEKQLSPAQALEAINWAKAWRPQKSKTEK